VGPAVRDRDQDVANPAPERRLLGLAADKDPGLAAEAVADLDVSPGDSPTPTSPERLQYGLLRRPAAREGLDRMLARLTVADLALGVDPAEEQLAMLLDHLTDARAFDDVGADSQDFHARPAPSSPPAHARSFHPLD